MEHTFDIDVTGLQIDNYEEYLSKFPGWVENKRDINLNLVLSEETKIQFDVEIDNSHSVKYISLLDKDFDVSHFKDVSKKAKDALPDFTSFVKGYLNEK